MSIHSNDLLVIDFYTELPSLPFPEKQAFSDKN